MGDLHVYGLFVPLSHFRATGLISCKLPEHEIGNSSDSNYNFQVGLCTGLSVVQLNRHSLHQGEIMNQILKFQWVPFKPIQKDYAKLVFFAMNCSPGEQCYVAHEPFFFQDRCQRSLQQMIIQRQMDVITHVQVIFIFSR